MRAYLLKRLLLIPVTLLGITLITFAVMKLAPGDPTLVLRAQASGSSIKATQTNQEALEQWRKERHLDRHWTVQYLIWLRDIALLDFGHSFSSGQPRVMSLLWSPMLLTLLLNSIAFALVYMVAIPIGIVGAAKQFTIWDRATTIGVFLLYSLPTFWIGTLLIAYCTGGLFPTSGYPGELRDIGFLEWIWTWSRHLFLPIVCETYWGFAFLSRQMRSSLLEQIRQDFVRTARAKGLSERVVVLRHATRNALIPVLTLFGTLLPELIAGSVIIEQLFSIPGMGRLFFDAIFERDYPVIMGIETVSALLTLLGILVSDILYVVVNPTIAYD